MTNPFAKKSSDFFRYYPLWVAALLLFTFLLRLIDRRAAPRSADVLRHNSLYEVACLACIDTATRVDKKDSALVLANTGLQFLPGSASLKEKKEKLLARKKG